MEGRSALTPPPLAARGDYICESPCPPLGDSGSSSSSYLPFPTPSQLQLMLSHLEALNPSFDGHPDPAPLPRRSESPLQPRPRGAHREGQQQQPAGGSAPGARGSGRRHGERRDRKVAAAAPHAARRAEGSRGAQAGSAVWSPASAWGAPFFLLSLKCRPPPKGLFLWSRVGLQASPKTPIGPSLLFS